MNADQNVATHTNGASAHNLNGSAERRADDAPLPTPQPRRLFGFVDPMGPGDDEPSDFEAAIANAKQYMAVAAAVLAKLHGDLMNINAVTPCEGETDATLARGMLALYDAAAHVDLLRDYRYEDDEPRHVGGAATSAEAFGNRANARENDVCSAAPIAKTEPASGSPFPADCHQSATIALEKLGQARFVLDEFYRYIEEERPEGRKDMGIATEEYAGATQALHVACSEMENIVRLTGDRAREVAQ